MENLPPYLPQALYGLGVLLAGFGGRWVGQRNGNGKWNGNDRRDYVTKNEIMPQLKNIDTRLGEVREDFQAVFGEMSGFRKDVSNLGQIVARIQGAHEGK